METKVMIGIQARTSSTRLPQKVLERVGSQTVLEHVISRCKNAARYMSNIKRFNLDAEVVVLAPYNDPVIGHVGRKCKVIVGPEDDVLARYVIGANELDADYIIRITSDCPLIPPWVISKTMSIALVAGYHYCSNVDDRFRSHPDGWDCEVISREALAWASQEANTDADKEHVTSVLRRDVPDQLTRGFIGSNLDMSDLKLSVDTKADLETVRGYYERVRRKQLDSYNFYGKEKVHLV